MGTQEAAPNLPQFFGGSQVPSPWRQAGCAGQSRKEPQLVICMQQGSTRSWGTGKGQRPVNLKEKAAVFCWEAEKQCLLTLALPDPRACRLWSVEPIFELYCTPSGNLSSGLTENWPLCSWARGWEHSKCSANSWKIKLDCPNWIQLKYYLTMLLALK